MVDISMLSFLIYKKQTSVHAMTFSYLCRSVRKYGVGGGWGGGSTLFHPHA